MRLDPVDIAIVGAGFGGAAFAWRLSQKRPDLRILCVERGGFPDRSAFPAWRSDWQRAVLNEWATSPNLRLKSGRKPASADYPIDDSQSDFKPLMWNGVGGSTIAWAAHFPRLHPSNFRTRSLDGVGDDWPFSYADLEPYYDLNDAECGLSGLAGDPAYPRKPERVLAASCRSWPHGHGGGARLRRARAHWWPVDAAIEPCAPTRESTDAIIAALASSAAPPRQSPRPISPAGRRRAENGVELRTGCVVQPQVEIEAGRARGIRDRDEAGREVSQAAQIVVVAGNGIGTPRLLLASGIESPALGRNLMFHGAAYARGLFREELDGPVGPVGCALYSHEFYETDAGRGFKRGVHLQVTRENPLLIQAARLDKPWGEAAQHWLREEFRHSVAVLVCWLRISRKPCQQGKPHEP